MKNVVLIDSYYNEETGISYAEINTDLGIFYAYSQLYEEDRNESSSFAGCSYAEAKAQIKYLKRKIRFMKERLKGIEICVNLDKENRKLRKQYYVTKNEIKQIENLMEEIKKSMFFYMQNRKEILDKYFRKEKD